MPHGFAAATATGLSIAKTSPGAEDVSLRIVSQASLPRARPFLSASDARAIGALLWLAPAAWFLPESLWGRVCRGAVAVRCLFSDRPVRSVATQATAAFGPTLSRSSLRAIAVGLQASKYELAMQIFRIHRPGGWHPLIHVDGAARLDEALRNGRGAILWVSHFVFNSTIAKIGLHSRGYRVSHLSRPEHGFSKTRFGIAMLNPIRRRAEDCYLDDRIVIDRERMTGTMRTLQHRLRANGIVSITIGPWEGRQLVHIPLFGGHLHVATGAIGLSLQTSAPVLPVFVVLDRDSGAFRLIVEPRLAIPADCSKTEAIAAAAADYAGRLQAYVRRYPDQWRGWGEWHSQGG